MVRPMSDAARILVVDDEESICFAFKRYFERAGHEVAVAAAAKSGVELYRSFRPDVTFLDIRLPDRDGLEVLAELRRLDPEARVIIITAYGTLETAARAAGGQAFDYLVKPLDLDRAAALVGQALAARDAARRAGQRSATPLHRGWGLDAEASPEAEEGARVIGSSAAMQEVYRQIGRVAQSDSAVLIRGQTGTGKEVIARAIHAHSRRRDGPFVAVNCGALPENLVESELFGYVQGAFSGAQADKRGRFEMADGGTLFLDEVGELPLHAQVKLLRFLDCQIVERLGSVEAVQVNARILAATNRDLDGAVEAGQFRRDLFYRLAVVRIEVPTLARRGGDIAELARHFLAALTRPAGPPALSAEAMELLERYSWPGNVRELRNAMEHAVTLSGGAVILPAHLPEAVRSGRAAPAERSPIPLRGDWSLDAARSDAERLLEQYLSLLGAEDGRLYAAAIEPLERAMVRRALEQAGGNQSAAAKILGLHRNTLRKKIAELGM